jgi:tetratricopeptide (TPR) repeat protein
MESKNELINYLNSISIFILGVLLFGLPLVITTATTDFFTLPKQIILIAGVSIVLLVFGIKTIAEKSLKIRKTPFDLPIILFTAAVFISSILAVNRIESLTAFFPFLFAILAYFAIVNFAKDKRTLEFLQAALLAGASVVSVLVVLSFLKIYILPFDFSKIQSFSLLGSLLDQAIYLALILPIAVFPIVQAFKSGEQLKTFKGARLWFTVAGIIILLGLILTAYQLIAKQRPALLPYETGFQTAFAAISQDAGRIAQGFFFGSGIGTYGTDFTRFKQATFNMNQNLWSFTFYKSSSFILELLATSGILGFISFFYLIYKALKEKPMLPALVVATVLLFLLPFSFMNIALFFILLALFSVSIGLKHSNKVYDIDLQLVALRKGLISFESTETETKESRSIMLPIFFCIVIFLAVAFAAYNSYVYVSANVLFQDSLVAAAQNKGTQTYQSQAKALGIFKDSDAYQRIFAQTNLALANSLASQIPQGSSPSAQTTQTIYTLIQQSINAGRQAATISPQSATNWQNLSSIYRSLIGFGQNADQFAVLTAQQAVNLDPSNPQQHISLGGIYYQLGAWDRAAQEFQTAINLKPDFANAYYNLGHALEQKGDLKSALSQYQTVKTLIVNDPKTLEKITVEIDTLQKRINGEEISGTPANGGSLEVSTPSAKLPTQNPPVAIPAPGSKTNPTTTTTTKPVAPSL